MTYGMGFDVEQDYFHWLCEMVHIDMMEASYWLLARDLHHKIFVPLIERDENRAFDGLELREEYLSEMMLPEYCTIDGECTLFEMLIALARRMDFETSNPYDLDGKDNTAYWFWEMMDNLGLSKYSDDTYADMKDEAISYVDWAMDKLLKRKYEPNGDGGLFPLKHCHENQCNVEIWYQMHAYLNEQNVV